ncbi:MAG TPA: hypothetical protein VMS56_03625 [Thermoanaerobaculia bacterium]|nr:hypothetical protein [Thermoanaerobaculia bacterium]
MERADQTETMRHIPSLEEVRRRVGSIYRSRLDRALTALTHPDLPGPIRERGEEELARVTRWLGRVAELTPRGGHPHRHEEADPISRVQGALDGAVEALERLDRAQFGRRAPSRRFEQSGSEPLWQAVLATGTTITLLLETLSAFDRDLWWNLLDPNAPEPVMMQ